jgi:uncharacterized protein (UPF0248 family)
MMPRFPAPGLRRIKCRSGRWQTVAAHGGAVGAMIPIHELLARIRIAAGERFGFEALEEDGSVHSVPYHRVRAVWRDGELIWSRG